MMNHFRLLAFSVFFCAAHTLTSQQTVMSVLPGSQPPYNDLPELIRQHLTGAGVDILNVEFAGAAAAVGYFTDGDLAVGLQRGLLLTTGRANSQAGTFGISGADEIGSEFANTSNGIFDLDPVLSQLVNVALYDLTRYRITFRPQGDSIRFRYVFASEEYPEYACSSYNDVFGFFLDGPQPGSATPYQSLNIALVPGTNLPVAINNLHPANPDFPPCPPFNAQFYNNNNFSDVQPVYDGFTDVFVAEASVVPCAIYQMTLAIADAGDGAYDSAVFLEANSFGGEPDIAASFSPNANIIPENAQADTVSLTFTAIPANLLPLTITIGGTAQNGVDYQWADSSAVVVSPDAVLHFLFQPIPDTLSENFETITLTVSADSSCFTRTFTLFIADPDSTFKPLDTLFLSGGTATLGVATTVLVGQAWTFSNETDVALNATNVLFFSEIQADMPFANLSDLSLLESVCLNIQHDWVGDLSLYLFAPNNRFVELSTGNGANGDNYTATCFSPSATAPINFPGPYAPASAAPFTGTFQPEGEWSDIQFAPLNGTWKLGVIDNAAGFSGVLLDWGITFSGEKIGDFKYLWSTGDTTSELTVTSPGTYMVTVTNAVSKFEKTFVVLPECPFSDIQLSACSGESVVFGTLVLSENNPTGVVMYPLPGDCDSTVHVSVSFFPAAFDSINATIQQGQSYEFGGQMLTQSGDYSIVLTAANGCDSIVYLHLDVTTGTQAPLEQLIKVQPNPAQDKVFVTWDKNLIFNKITIFNTAGNLLFEKQPAPNVAQETIEMRDWPKGIYFMALEGTNGVLLKKLVKL